MQPRIQILLVYLFVLVLALAISSSIVISGRHVSETTSQLAEVKLPRLQGINDLYLAIVEHERLLYEYYATTDSDKFALLLSGNESRIRDDLALISEAFPDWEPLEDLRKEEGMVKAYTSQLDLLFRADQVDWDLARELLQEVSKTGRRIFPILDMLVERIQQDALETAAMTQQSTDRSSTQVIAFAALILVVAGFVGYFFNSYIRETANRRRLAMFAERSPNPIMSFTWNGRLNYTNPACDALMKQLDNHSGRPESLLPEDFDQILLTLQSSKDDYSQWVAKGTGNATLEYSLSLLRDLRTCHLFIEDITAQVEANKSLQYQAYHDLLTDLPNRRFFNEAVAELVQQKDKKPFTVILLSVDRFDQVVASAGYQIADKLLKEVADNLDRTVKNFSSRSFKNRNFRLDSSKFALLLEDFPDQNFAENLATELLEEMKVPMCIDSKEFHISISIGLSHYPEQADSAAELLSNADAALSRVKRDGGDGLLCYNQNIHAIEQAWIEIERNLRQAIDNEELVLFYQPKISAQGHQLSGVEALIRWRRSDGSMVSPGEFIPVAEQSGLIVMIGEWVIHEACRQFENWADDEPVNIAINLSARQFRHPDFIQMMSECLHHYAIEPDMIELEITESLLMNDIESSIQTMHQLKELGFKLSIDDFGTGYSSLSYLKDFPIDKLKIDRAFVMNIENNPADETLAKTIVDLAHNMDLTVVAEGVENEQQLGILTRLGVEEIQGFYFSKPVPAVQIEEKYRQNS